MPKVFRRREGGVPSGPWLVKVRDASGRWKQLRLTEARTKADAERLAEDLAMRARRQREGLEAPPPDRSLTVDKLLVQWLARARSASPSHGRLVAQVRKHFEAGELAGVPLAQLTSTKIEAFLEAKALKEDLAPATLNHLRASLRTAWNWALRVGILSGPNPATNVQRRKVPVRVPQFLEGHQVAGLLAELRESDRLMVAVLILAGVRQGELFGLRVADVDLERRLLTIRRSYDRQTTKGKRERVVPIAAELVPYLERARKLAPGELLFPRSDGKMRTEQEHLDKRMKSAMGRAAIVDGYLHTCRRCKAKGTPHEERHQDNGRRHCPACGMSLWAKAIPKPLRLHDLRHTTATLLLSLGVDPFAVAKILGHSDARVTLEVYAHLVPGYLQAQIDRLTGIAPYAPATPAEAAAAPVQASVAVGAVVVQDPPEAATGANCQNGVRTPSFRGETASTVRPVRLVERHLEGVLKSVSSSSLPPSEPGLGAPVVRTPGAPLPEPGDSPGNVANSQGDTWRALVDSNHWPSASELYPAVIPLHPSASLSVSSRTVTDGSPSLPVPLVPPNPSLFGAPVVRVSEASGPAAHFPPKAMFDRSDKSDSNAISPATPGGSAAQLDSDSSRVSPSPEAPPTAGGGSLPMPEGFSLPLVGRIRGGAGRRFLFTVGELAEVLRVSTATVYGLIERGELEAFKVGTSWRTGHAELAAFLARCGRRPR